VSRDDTWSKRWDELGSILCQLDPGIWMNVILLLEDYTAKRISTEELYFKLLRLEPEAREEVN
jgi:hypothetical protein